MDIKAATDIFSALSQSTRLETLRLLIRHLPEGLPAGEVARELGIPHNTMSSHLAVLARVGLVSSRRQSRQIIYQACFDCITQTVNFLVQDCCSGRPEVCQPLQHMLSDCLADTADAQEKKS